MVLLVFQVRRALAAHADVGYADAVVRADGAARRRRLLLAVNGGLQNAGSAHGRCCPRSGADEIASRLPNVRGNIQLLVHIRIPHCNEWHSVDASGSLAIQRPLNDRLDTNIASLHARL